MQGNLRYRAFTRIGDGKVPDARTLARQGQDTLGVIGKVRERLRELAIHYPTDSGLLGDGARVLQER